jgi:hypothetical protein
MCILISLYNASHNKIKESTIYYDMDPELFVIRVTVYVTNKHKDQYNIQYH